MFVNLNMFWFSLGEAENVSGIPFSLRREVPRDVIILDVVLFFQHRALLRYTFSLLFCVTPSSSLSVKAL